MAAAVDRIVVRSRSFGRGLGGGGALCLHCGLQGERKGPLSYNERTNAVHLTEREREFGHKNSFECVGGGASTSAAALRGELAAEPDSIESFSFASRIMSPSPQL